MVANPRGGMIVRRNDRCPCNSGKKFKFCCSPEAPAIVQAAPRRPLFIDSGESPVRWVICDPSGVRFFADKDNRALLFDTYEDALQVARLEDFADQNPGEINVAGVGPTKLELLKEKIPYVEVDVEIATQLVRERIEYGRAGELTPAQETLDAIQGGQETTSQGTGEDH
jgi:hypothetical protein